MSVADKQLFLCSCNGTAPIDAGALADALSLPARPAVRTMLCQKELAACADHAAGEVIVACTQEASLFADVAGEAARAQTVRFVNLREAGGWSPEAESATPKLAALLAQAALPDPDPVPAIGYRSEGQTLIVGPAEAALAWADVLKDKLSVTVLATGRAGGAELPAVRDFPVFSGTLTGLSGWLGAFDATWRQDKLANRALSAPALAGNFIAVGDFEGYVHWLNKDDGSFVARRASDGGRVAVTPQALSDNAVLVQTAKGGLYAYDVK